MKYRISNKDSLQAFGYNSLDILYSDILLHLGDVACSKIQVGLFWKLRELFYEGMSKGKVDEIRN